jgi:hypothetical protein
MPEGRPMHTRSARVARGTAAALVATVVAAVSHTLAGDAAPSLFGLAAAFVLAAATCSLLAGRTLSTARLIVAIVLSQSLFHLVFAGVGTPVPVPHVHGLPRTVELLPHVHGDGMTLAHLAAALVTALLLRVAEGAFWALAEGVRTLAARAARLLAPAPRRAPVRIPVGTGDAAVALRRLLAAHLRHRGPPVVSAAL